MSRYTGPTWKISRRLGGFSLSETGGKELRKRPPYPPRAARPGPPQQAEQLWIAAAGKTEIALSLRFKRKAV